jgi:Mn2+/Fe2+ NRAMP family transporter
MLSRFRSRSYDCARRGIPVQYGWQKHLLTFLMVFGLGLIVMEADNDAGAVSTYMQAGAQYRLHLLWILILSRTISDSMMD